jgi:hypothetical protein
MSPADHPIPPPAPYDADAVLVPMHTAAAAAPVVLDIAMVEACGPADADDLDFRSHARIDRLILERSPR